MAALARHQHRAGEEIAFFEGDVDGLEVGYPNLGKFARAAHEFAAYIASNAGSLINYGERFRSGERISSCLAESTVNAVISKRFAKRQQMQWTKRGAHLLLQNRTRGARRDAPAVVRALVSRARQRQWRERSSSRRSVNTPDILMNPQLPRGAGPRGGLREGGARDAAHQQDAAGEIAEA